MDVDRQFEKLKEVIKKAANDEGFLSVRVVIDKDESKEWVYWLTVTGISKKFNLKANYKLILHRDNKLTLKFQHCSPRVASHEIERAIGIFDFSK